MAYFIAPWYRVRADENTLVFRHGDRYTVFEGAAVVPAVKAVTEKLLATKDSDKAIESFDESSRSVAKKIINKLVQLNVAVKTWETESPTAMSLREKLGEIVSADEIESSLQGQRVGVISDRTLSKVATSVLKRLLDDVLIVDTVSPENAEAELDNMESDRMIVCAPSSDTSKLLLAVNKWALKNNRSWMQVLPFNGSRAAVGPLFIPRETGCYNCFRLRTLSASPSVDEAMAFDRGTELPGQEHTSETWSSPAEDMVVWATAVGLLQQEVLDLSNLPLTPLRGQCHTLSFTPGGVDIKKHRLFKVPRCPECQGANLPLPQPWPTILVEGIQ